ncbi:MAG: hypothetical protein LQ347_006762 [Umbilicaria vellea]|nr:MAG: hypothetical protein LQ347_006762 [Umbilicaria vellea]
MRSAASPVLSLLSFLLLLPSTIATSLSQFQSIANFPAPCETAYNQQISGCTDADFSNGAPCSATCIRGLQTLTTQIESGCAGSQADPNTLIGMFFVNKGVTALCPNYAAPVASVPAASSSSQKPAVTTTISSAVIIKTSTIGASSLSTSMSYAPYSAPVVIKTSTVGASSLSTSMSHAPSSVPVYTPSSTPAHTTTSTPTHAPTSTPVATTHALPTSSAPMHTLSIPMPQPPTTSPVVYTTKPPVPTSTSSTSTPITFSIFRPHVTLTTETATHRTYTLMQPNPTTVSSAPPPPPTTSAAAVSSHPPPVSSPTMHCKRFVNRAAAQSSSTASVQPAPLSTSTTTSTTTATLLSSTGSPAIDKTAINDGSKTVITSKADQTASSNADAFGGGGSPFEISAGVKDVAGVSKVALLAVLAGLALAL